MCSHSGAYEEFCLLGYRGGVQLGPLGAPGDYDGREIGGMIIGEGN
jgi:hypothetical protein